MPETTAPPFPDDIPVAPLLVIDYALIKAGDQDEIDKLWKAATELGFWYTKNHDMDKEVEDMYELSTKTLELPLEEKIKSEGHKRNGRWATDETGSPDNIEFMDIAKDDILAWPKRILRSYPHTVNDLTIESTLKPYLLKSLDLCFTAFNIFDDKLGLPAGRLVQNHTGDNISRSEIRCIRCLPRPEVPAHKLSLGVHTDFGSMTILHPRLGGLQVLPPGSTEWLYVKPVPGYIICNLGDAMAIWSGGILRSNQHRVVNPPKEQASLVRWSLGYFTRPNDNCILAPLVNESAKIAQHAAQTADWKENPNLQPQTAADWYTRRNNLMVLNTFKGPESWWASRGTEHTEIPVA